MQPALKFPHGKKTDGFPHFVKYVIGSNECLHEVTILLHMGNEVIVKCRPKEGLLNLNYSQNTYISLTHTSHTPEEIIELNLNQSV